MRKLLATIVLAVGLTSCEAMQTVLEYPVSLFSDDGEEVETTVGEIAETSGGGLVKTLLTSIDPTLGLLGGAAAAAVIAAARRKKRLAAEAAGGKKKK